jgi:hypothetical protein
MNEHGSIKPQMNSADEGDGNSLYENILAVFAGLDCQIQALLAGFGNPAKP